MLTLPRRLGLALLLTIPFSAFAQAPQTVTITKCQNCSTKAAQGMQACQASGGGATCQKTYQKRMAHCNKKWCSPKMTKVKVRTGS